MRRIVVVSIIGIDGSIGGYNAAKVAHEQAMLDGPIPAQILRAAQFHEFVEQLVGWGTQGDVAYVPAMRTQLVAARAVAEQLVELATDPVAETTGRRSPRSPGPARSGSLTPRVCWSLVAAGPVQSRRSQRSGQPRPRPVRERRAAARPARRSRRSLLRGLASLDPRNHPVLAKAIKSPSFKCHRRSTIAALGLLARTR